MKPLKENNGITWWHNTKVQKEICFICMGLPSDIHVSYGIMELHICEVT